MQQVGFIASVSKELPMVQAQKLLEEAGLAVLSVQNQIRVISGTAETVRAVINFAHPQIEVEVERTNQTQL